MIQDQSSNQLSITGESVNHVHDLNHVQVDGLILNSDNLDGLYDDVYKLVCKVGMEFSAKCSSGNAGEQRFVDFLLADLELLQEVE